jgi:hypothetical protein
MTNQPITPLRQRMIEDMTIRRLKASTQDFYQRAVAKYAQHFRRSPAELDYEHVRQYQLHLAQSGCKPGYVNHTMSALRFFYKVTMGRRDALEMIALAKEPKKLRQVLTPEEVVRLIEAAPSRKYRCAFSVAYGAGLRSSEVVSLKIPTSTAHGWCCASKTARAAGIAWRSSLRRCWRSCARGGRSPSPRCSCFRVGSKRPITSALGNIIAPAGTRRSEPGSIALSIHICCGTRLRRTCSMKVSTSA